MGIPNIICHIIVEDTTMIASSTCKKRLKIMEALVIKKEKANTQENKRASEKQCITCITIVHICLAGQGLLRSTKARKSGKDIIDRCYFDSSLVCDSNRTYDKKCKSLQCPGIYS